MVRFPLWGGGGGVKMSRIFFMWRRRVEGVQNCLKNIILCYDQTCILNPKSHLHILGQYNYQESYYTFYNLQLLVYNYEKPGGNLQCTTVL